MYVNIWVFLKKKTQLAFLSVFGPDLYYLLKICKRVHFRVELCKLYTDIQCKGPIVFYAFDRIISVIFAHEHTKICQNDVSAALYLGLMFYSHAFLSKTKIHINTSVFSLKECINIEK